MRFSYIASLALVTVSLLSVGCSNTSASHEYYKAREEAKLEIPPGMDRPIEDTSREIPEGEEGVTTYSAYAGGCKDTSAKVAAMPKQEYLTIKREGPYLWLVVNAEPEQVWPEAKQFWDNKGLKLDREDPKLGIMETDWAEYQEQGAQPMRDRFRLRFEYGELAGTTEIYLSQRSQALGNDEVWQAMNADPEDEVIMLKELAAHLGASDVAFKETETLQTEVQLQDRGKEGMTLIIQSDFKEAWKSVIKALESVGATVEERSINQRFLISRFEDKREKSNKKSWLGDVITPSEKHALSRFRLEFFDRQDGGITLQIQDLQAKPAKGKRAKTAMEQLEQALGEL